MHCFALHFYFLASEKGMVVKTASSRFLQSPFRNLRQKKGHLNSDGLLFTIKNFNQAQSYNAQFPDSRLYASYKFLLLRR